MGRNAGLRYLGDLFGWLLLFACVAIVIIGKVAVPFIQWLR